MGNPLLLVVGVVMGASMLYFWYCEMFSDGYIGWFGRFFNSIRWRGKNIAALSEPAAGFTACFGCIAALGTVIDPHVFQRGRNGFPFWEIWSLFWGIPTVLCMFLIFVGFIPFSLPEWMYPEYHAAKREERRRREAAERGEHEERDPFLGDDGVYVSQLGNVPIDIPEPVGLPSTGAPPPLQGPPEAEDPPLYDTNTADAFDITATTTALALPRTGAPTSHGIRPARVSRARRGRQESGDAATAGSILVQADNAEDPEQPSMPSEASSRSSQAQSSAESLEQSLDQHEGGAWVSS